MLDLPIDLGSTDPHAARVQGGVRAAEDDQSVVLGEDGVIPVMPYAGKALEVGGAVLAALRVVPEADRHRGEGCGADEFARRAADGAAFFVEDFDFHAKPTALEFAPPHRKQRIAEGETRDDVRASRNRGEQHPLLDVAVDVIEALGQERRAGGEDRLERAQAMALARFDPAFSSAARYLALVPKTVMPSASTRSHRTLPSG